jgi:hypothetical protein
MLGLGNHIGNYSDVWQPTDLSDLLVWYSTINGGDPTDGLYMEFSSGTKVAQWNDISGNSNHAGQTTAGKQPDFISATASVDFDATGGSTVDDYMELDTQLTLDTDDTGWTVAANYTSLNWDGSAQCIVGDVDNSQNFIRHNSGENKFLVKVGNNNNTIDLDTPSSLTDSQYYSVIVTCATDGTITLYINGVAQSDTEDCGTNDLTIDEICGKEENTQTLGGSVRDILVYRKPLAAAEIALLNSFLELRGF